MTSQNYIYIIFFTLILMLIIYSIYFNENEKLNIYNQDFEKKTFFDLKKHIPDIDAKLNKLIKKGKNNYDSNREYSDITDNEFIVDIMCSKNTYFEDEIMNLVRKIVQLENEIFKDHKNRLSNEIINETQYIEMKKLCNQLYYYIIHSYSFFIDNIYYLEFLYDKYINLYRFSNINEKIKFKNINVVEVSNHHLATEWVYHYYKNDILPSILHVDSHADINNIEIEYFDFLKKMKKSQENYDKKTLLYLYSKVLSDEVGNVIVPFLSPYKNNSGVFWLKPKWTTDNIGNFDAYLSIDEEALDLYTKRKTYFIKKDSNIEKNIEKNIPVSYVSCHVDNAKNYYLSISNNYILNIDLDYFVCFGTKYNQHQPLSDHRTFIDIGMVNKSEKYLINKNKEFLKEMEKIRLRIDKFLSFILFLKEKSIIPGLIIICDSSRSNSTVFHEPYLEKNSINDKENEYTPKYLSFWLHNTILNHLKEIFD